MFLESVKELSYTKKSELIQKQDKQKLIAEITLLVLSVFVICFGLGLVIYGIVQLSTLCLVIGTLLISDGLLGILLVSLLIRPTKNITTQGLERKEDFLEQAKTQRSWLIEFLLHKLAKKERERLDLERSFNDYMEKCKSDLQFFSEKFSQFTVKIKELELERQRLRQGIQKLQEKVSVTEKENKELIALRESLKKGLQDKLSKFRIIHGKIKEQMKEHTNLKEKTLSLTKLVQDLKQEISLKSNKLVELEREIKLLQEENKIKTNELLLKKDNLSLLEEKEN